MPKIPFTLYRSNGVLNAPSQEDQSLPDTCLVTSIAELRRKSISTSVHFFYVPWDQPACSLLYLAWGKHVATRGLPFKYSSKGGADHPLIIYRTDSLEV